MVTCVVVVIGLGLFGMQNANNSKSDLTLENVEALSQGDAGLDCRYVRKTESCTIYVGAHGKVKLLGGKIIVAGADGKIRIDGVVVCSAGGNTACSPIECSNLYSTLF